APPSSPANPTTWGKERVASHSLILRELPRALLGTHPRVPPRAVGRPLLATAHGPVPAHHACAIARSHHRLLPKEVLLLDAVQSKAYRGRLATAESVMGVSSSVLIWFW
ncbi:Os07g0669401, partial [Oryza sativa Japonica Group]